MVISLTTGFLLAGGQSTRMGRNKALLELDGTTLAQRALHKLAAVCPSVAIAGGAPELSAFAPVIPDLTPGCGPLGGIVSALQQSDTDWNLFLPVDLPLLPVRALRLLLAATPAHQITCFREPDGRVHPLCCLIARAALPVLERELHAGNLRVRLAFEATGSVGFLDTPDPDWFRNINTPEDFARLPPVEKPRPIQ